MAEKKNKINYKKDLLSSLKLSLSYQIILLGIIDNNNDPFTKILSELLKYKDIEEILNKKEKNALKFYYFNRKKISTILYDEEIQLDVDYFKDFIKIEKDLSPLIYLYLLLNYNENSVDYIYSIDSIKQINDLQNDNKDKIYKKLIISKIILVLINNYKQTDNYDEEEEEDLNKIEDDNNNFINKNINALNEIGFEMDKKIFISKNIDEIYSEIIKNLIISKKFDDYNYIYNIVNELDLENINITKIIFDKIYETLDNKSNSEYYMISNIDELIDEKKINFYYILFKYILKYSIYIYQNDFLKSMKKNILKIVKDDKLYHSLNNIKDLNFKERIQYTINIFTDSKYYSEKYINNKNNSELSLLSDTNLSSNNLLQTSNNINSSFKNDSISKETSSNINEENQKSNIPYQILNKSSFIFEINEKREIKFILNDNIKIDDKVIAFDDLKSLHLPENDEKLQKSFEKFLNFFSNFKNLYINKVEHNNKLKIFFEFNIEKENENDKFYNITLNYSLDFQEKNIGKYKTFNILNLDKDLLSKNDGFIHLLKKINELTKYNNKDKKKKKKESKSGQTYPVSDSSKYNNIIFPNIEINPILKKEIENSFNKDNKYQILELIQIIGEHKKNAEIIIETKNHNLITMDSNNELYLYILDNKYYKKKNDKLLTYTVGKKEENKKEVPMKILNIYKNENKEEVILCSKEGLMSIDINNNSFENSKYIKEGFSCSFYFEMKNNNYIIGGEKGIEHFCPIDKKIKSIPNAFRGGIKIDDNRIAFTSNSTLPKGNDKLIFYDIRYSKIVKQIESYSFTISTNSLFLITINKDKNSKILLCGCKAYKKNQKNGILLIDVNTYKEEFYETDDFEVYCFCPLSIIINKNKNKIINEKDLEILHTDYFLVGGFESKKRMGNIKLYKKNINNENMVTIEFIQDIIFPTKNIKRFYRSKDNQIEKKYNSEFLGFERTISCMIQSQINGNIIITSWDGNVYECEPPNISYYLYNDLLEKEEQKKENSKSN